MGKHLRRLLEESPYATNYGLCLLRDDPDVECLTPWADHFTGNPLLQAWHGGVVTGVIELTGALQAQKVSVNGECSLLSTNINFLRPTKGNSALHTRASLVRQGRQMLNIEVIAWQGSPKDPTACASLTYARRD